MYGARGEITALCSSSPYYPNNLGCTPQYAHLMFGGRLVRQFGAPVALDRLGSVKSQLAGSQSAPGYFSYNGVVTYLPFGKDLNQVFQDETKFGTYWEDSSTGFSYADQRYYASKYGRFMSADPYKASARPEDPRSLNRFSFTKNDPVNHTDRTGRFIDPDSCLNLVCEVALPVDCFDEFECEDQGGSPPVPPLRPVSPAPSKPAKPCNDAKNNRSRFFQQLPGLISVAQQLKVPTNFIVGLSSFESGWFDNHNVALNNLWGLTQGGHDNIQFSSIQAGNAYFVIRVGPYIQGAQTQADFFKGLQNEGYNSQNPNYYPLLSNRIDNIQNWGQACGVTF